MYYYKIADLIIKSVCELNSYKEFACKSGKADIIVTETEELPPPGQDRQSGMIVHRKLADGW